MNNITGKKEAEQRGIPQILVVDDNEKNLAILSLMLEKIGYKVYQAKSATDAYAVINSRDLDLVLLDIVLPDQSGFEILANIRSHSSMIELPVIMLTAMSENQNIVKALSMGANDYVTKPYDFSVINSRIKTQISLKQTEQALRESEERYSLVASATRDGLWDWRIPQDKVYYSANWKAIIGYGDNEVGTGIEEWFFRIHYSDIKHIKASMEKLKTGLAATFEAEYRILHKDGDYRWVMSRVIAKADKHNKVIRILGSLSDITDKKVINALTGLPNQTLLLDRIDQGLKQIQFGQKSSCAVFFIDLDRFKLINQGFGIEIGDRLIVEVAARIKAELKTNDTLAHFGRDEFIVLATACENYWEANNLAKTFSQTIAQPFHVAELEDNIGVTASIGIVLVDITYKNAETVLQHAESAMNRAKTEGYNRHRFYKKEMYMQIKERIRIENKLRMALEKDELVLYYQPQINIASGIISGMETLVRWHDPERGLIYPQELINMAENNGMISPIGEWILSRACRQNKLWQSQGLRPLRLAVNLSPRQFGHQDLFHTIEKILIENSLDPKYLELEITESNAMADAEASIKIMKELKNIGITFSIDDFGTGYSSLSLLKQLPLSTLKIDGSFIKDIPQDENAQVIVKAIIAMSRSLNLEVIAEGVENAAQLAFLKENGCEKYQGYLFSEPVPGGKMRELLEANHY